MTDSLTARIAALEAQGYELPRTRVCAAAYLTVAELELLTALEQAQAVIASEGELSKAAVLRTMKEMTIGAARLKLAEKRADELGRGLQHFYRIDEAYESAVARAEQAEAALTAAQKALKAEREHGLLAEQRIAKVEAALAAERESVEALGRSFDKMRAELHAERAQRCATCEYEPACNRSVTIKAGWQPLLDSCSEWIARKAAGK